MQDPYGRWNGSGLSGNLSDAGDDCPGGGTLGIARLPADPGTQAAYGYCVMAPSYMLTAVLEAPNPAIPLQTALTCGGVTCSIVNPAAGGAIYCQTTN